MGNNSFFLRSAGSCSAVPAAHTGSISDSYRPPSMTPAMPNWRISCVAARINRAKTRREQSSAGSACAGVFHCPREGPEIKWGQAQCPVEVGLEFGHRRVSAFRPVPKPQALKRYFMVGYELTGCLPWVFHGRIPSIVDGRERLTDQFTYYTFFPRQRRVKS